MEYNMHGVWIEAGVWNMGEPWKIKDNLDCWILCWMQGFNGMCSCTIQVSRGTEQA